MGDHQERQNPLRYIVFMCFAFLPIVSSVLDVPFQADLDQCPDNQPLGLDSAIAVTSGVALLSFLTASSNVAALTYIVICSWTSGFSGAIGSFPFTLEILVLSTTLAVNAKDSERLFFILAITSVFWMRASASQLAVVVLVFAVIGSRSLPDGIKRLVAFLVTGVLIIAMLLDTGHNVAARGLALSLLSLAYAVSSSKANQGLCLVGVLVMMIIRDPITTGFVLLLLLILKRKPELLQADERDTQRLLMAFLCRESLAPSPGLTRMGLVTSLTGVACLTVLTAFLVLELEKAMDRLDTLMRNVKMEISLAFAAYASLVYLLSLGAPMYLTASLFVCAVVVLVPYHLKHRFKVSPGLVLAALMTILMLWIAFALAVYSIAPPMRNKWYNLNENDQFAVCRQVALTCDVGWKSGEYSKSMGVWNLNALGSSEFLACATGMRTPIDMWKTKSVSVVGDSVGRFLFHALTNDIISNTHGFPKDAYHGDIEASSKLRFIWAPYAIDLMNVTLSNDQDVLVISIGLWDRLWKRDVMVFGETVRQFVRKVSIQNRQPTLVWLEMTPTVTENLFGPAKQEYLDEALAQSWRIELVNATREYSGISVILPTVDLCKGRPSHDGVHYDIHTYRAIAKKFLRGVLPTNTMLI